MHKCIEARDIYIYIFTDWQTTFKRYFIFSNFLHPHNSDRDLLLSFALPRTRNRTFKAALYTGCAVKKRRNAQTFGIESRRPRLREKKFVFVSWRTNERPCSWKRTKFFITVGKRGGHAGERERQRKSHVRYRTRPCLLNFKSRQSNYGGCSLNRAICSSRLNPHC